MGLFRGIDRGHGSEDACIKILIDQRGERLALLHCYGRICWREKEGRGVRVSGPCLAVSARRGVGFSTFPLPQTATSYVYT